MEEVPGLGLEWPDTEDMTGLPGTRGTEVREPPGVPSWPCSVWLAGAGEVRLYSLYCSIGPTVAISK